MEFEKLKQKSLAEAVGVSNRTVLRWTKAGLPRNPDGTYHLPKCLEWLIEGAKQETIPTDTESEKWLTAYRKERAIIAQIERKRLEGQLISRIEVAKAWSQRIAEVRSGLLSLQHRLPPFLEGRSQKEMMQIIADEVWNLLDTYSRNGKFTAKKKAKHATRK